eukprot:292143-Karenia_brevis.AAC.1
MQDKFGGELLTASGEGDINEVEEFLTSKVMQSSQSDVCLVSDGMVSITDKLLKQMQELHLIFDQ